MGSLWAVCAEWDRFRHDIFISLLRNFLGEMKRCFGTFYRRMLGGGS